MRVILSLVLILSLAGSAKADSYDEYKKVIRDLESLEEYYPQPIWDNERENISHLCMRLFLEKNWQRDHTFTHNWVRLVKLWNSYASHYID